ncbi:MAG: restriction endonuclease subunit S [Thermoguttaceae bacterium]|nr:restriction endonuclease subunit S [Thermoguttaceae bacterium]
MIDISGWGEFRIGDLFHVLKGKRLTKMQMRDGEIPFIGSSAVNNGVTASIANDENIVQPPALTVCYNGSVGSAFFQDKPFAASDDVNVLTLKDRLLTRETALFLAPIFRIYGRKYAYADKWRKEIMEQDMIKLPVTLLGEPDWDYMESYMKQIMDRSECAVSALLRVV